MMPLYLPSHINVASVSYCQFAILRYKYIFESIHVKIPFFSSWVFMCNCCCMIVNILGFHFIFPWHAYSFPACLHFNCSVSTGVKIFKSRRSQKRFPSHSQHLYLSFFRSAKYTAYRVPYKIGVLVKYFFQ